MDNTKKKKLLIVEDDFFIRDIYEIEAKSRGFDVISAVDGEEAINKINAEAPDLVVLLDLMLPKKDGITVTKEVRANPVTSKIPIIIITNLEDAAKEKEAREAGANDYLLKIRSTPPEVLDKIKLYFNTP